MTGVQTCALPIYGSDDDSIGVDDGDCSEDDSDGDCDTDGLGIVTKAYLKVRA